MSADTEKKSSSIAQLVAMLKEIVSSDEPTEEQLAEVGESLLAAVKAALSGAS